MKPTTEILIFCNLLSLSAYLQAPAAKKITWAFQKWFLSISLAFQYSNWIKSSGFSSHLHNVVLFVFFGTSCTRRDRKWYVSFWIRDGFIKAMKDISTLKKWKGLKHKLKVSGRFFSFTFNVSIFGVCYHHLDTSLIGRNFRKFWLYMRKNPSLSLFVFQKLSRKPNSNSKIEGSYGKLHNLYFDYDYFVIRNRQQYYFKIVFEIFFIASAS